MNASALLDKDWEGHYFKNNLLYVPEWRRGLTQLQKEEAERHNDEINAPEVKADYY